MVERLYEDAWREAARCARCIHEGRKYRESLPKLTQEQLVLGNTIFKLLVRGFSLEQNEPFRRTLLRVEKIDKLGKSNVLQYAAAKIAIREAVTGQLPPL